MNFFKFCPQEDESIVNTISEFQMYRNNLRLSFLELNVGKHYVNFLVGGVYASSLSGISMQLGIPVRREFI